ITDIVTDHNGRKPVGGLRGNGRPGVEAETDPKEVEAQKFARELAGELKKGLDDHAYDALILAAPPHFLGLLKDALDDQVRRRVEATIAKDLSPLAPSEIQRRLR